MGAERAWPRARGSVLVAVLDTGVEASTPSLAGAVSAGTDLSGGAADADCFGRGTFIASLIASRATPGSDVMGVAPDATIFPVRIAAKPDGVRNASELPGRIAAGVRAAVAAKASIVVTPFSTAIDAPELRAAVSEANDAGVLLVAPVTAASKGKASFPAGMDGVLAVAPLTTAGGADPTSFGATPVVSAPSDGLVAAAPRGGGMVTAGGAELAVAYAAGAAALVRDEFPDATPAEVIARLVDTADQTTALTGTADGPTFDASLGYGVVNPVAAVTRIGSIADAGSFSADHARIALPAEPDRTAVIVAAGIVVGVLLLLLLCLGPLLGVASRSREARAAEATAARVRGAQQTSAQPQSLGAEAVTTAAGSERREAPAVTTDAAPTPSMSAGDSTPQGAR